MTARRVAYVLVVACLVYLVLAGQRGVELIRVGGVAPVALGIAVIVVPLVVAYLIYREMRFGLAVQDLGRTLGEAGALPTDDLPRLPSGRVDQAAADEVFERRRCEVEADPYDPGAWFRLSIAYDDARDRRRAREAMRRAVALAAARGAAASG